jgi:hypothetical protein
VTSISGSGGGQARKPRRRARRPRRPGLAGAIAAHTPHPRPDRHAPAPPPGAAGPHSPAPVVGDHRAGGLLMLEKAVAGFGVQVNSQPPECHVPLLDNGHVRHHHDEPIDMACVAQLLEHGTSEQGLPSARGSMKGRNASHPGPGDRIPRDACQSGRPHDEDVQRLRALAEAVKPRGQLAGSAWRSRRRSSPARTSSSGGVTRWRENGKAAHSGDGSAASETSRPVRRSGRRGARCGPDEEGSCYATSTPPLPSTRNVSKPTGARCSDLLSGRKFRKTAVW